WRTYSILFRRPAALTMAYPSKAPAPRCLVWISRRAPRCSGFDVHFHKALGLLAQVLARGRIEAAEGLRLELPLLIAPGARHAPVDQKGGNRLRRPGVEDLRPVLLGQNAVRRACTRSVASQVGRKRTGAGVSGSGSGARGRSISSAPSSASKRRRRI